jgi:ribose 5-phosphate isomerase B
VGIIAIASDHAGVELKDQLKDHLTSLGHDVIDLGPENAASVDYPDYADKLAAALKAKHAEQGVLVCGSGIGIGIAANRHRHIRAALCHDGLSAKLSRQHNDANVLVLGARLIGSDTAKDCATIFFSTAFEGGRHQNRVNKLS